MRKCLICHERNIEGYGICESCKTRNEEMLKIHADLTGYTALITGGRVRIGYATALRLLRDNAKVIVITRYPYDALSRYSKEPDYGEFCDRLIIYGFNLLYVNRFGELIEALYNIVPEGLDILVNNAAQTIKKNPEYYLELEEQEENMRKLYSSKKDSNIIPFVRKNQAVEQMLMPLNNQINVKQESPMYNSWVAKPEDIGVQELLEVQLINVTAPFLLTAQLKSLMKKSKNKNRFIINVSSVEGRFQKKKKLSRHVHTNMAKASLNMMTNSLSMEYEKDRIFMYSVDPGWVSNQFPKGYNASINFEPYLSFEDAASRICYPIYTKLHDDYIKDAGSLWKDYNIIDYCYS